MIRFSIHRPVAISMTYLAAALLGVAAWRNIPIELLPDTRLPQLYVRAVWPGASPEVTEALLTSPIEAAVEQVRGVAKVTSVSDLQQGMGSATITVQFARGTDMNFARLELSERLAAIEKTLPAGAQRPTVEQYVPDQFKKQQRDFLRYTVTGPYTLEALRAHVDDRIVPELLQVDGVGNVDVFGGRPRVLEIDLNTAKIAALGLTPAVVGQRIRDLQYVHDAGEIQQGTTVRTVAIRQSAASTRDIRQLVLLADHDRLVRVSDVATVRDTYEEPTSYYRIDGMPALSFTVLREPGTNAITVSDRVKARLAALAGAHPPGVRLILDQDESKAIRAQLSDLRSRALVSALVIFVVLLAFLRSFRSAFIVFATIAFSILIALNLLYFGGYTLNVLTLMGLAMGFGLIVDNAIVVLQNIYRRWRLNESAVVAAERGSREVVLAILASTLTTVVVFIPFVYLQGELRLYYVPLAIAVGFSLIASLFVSFSFIPALAARLLARRGRVATPPAHPVSDEATTMGAVVQANAGVSPRAPFYVRIYERLIHTTLRWPWVAVTFALLALVGSYHLFDKYVTRGTVWGGLGQGQTYIEVSIDLPRGSELERSDQLARYFEERLHAMPEVARFVTNVQTNYARIHVTFPDSLEQTVVPLAIKEQLVSFALQFGGADVIISGYGPSFGGSGGMSGANYSIKVLGYNYEMVRAIAEGLGRRLQRFARVRDVNTNSSGYFAGDRVSELVLTVDRQRLALHGLTVQDVVRQVAASIRGRTSTNMVTVGGAEVRLEVKRQGADRIDVHALEQVLLPGRSGESVRLGDVASIAERDVLGRVVREDQRYQRNVAYEFRGPSKLGDRVRDAVVAATTLPDGYTIETSNLFEFGADEQQQIYGVLTFALVLIVMVTAALFESVRQPLCVLLTVPMALIGVFLLFFYINASFTREAYIGVIMMGGVVVNNAILLIDRINQLRRHEGIALEPAIVQGTLQRVQPILMTSVTTILGLLPLVLFSASVDANIWNALGYSLIGGLASSTVLVLTVTPALYLLFERRPERRRLKALETAQEQPA
jgi:HAE1 family hydrophobic/amphiphilic exporter-1